MATSTDRAVTVVAGPSGSIKDILLADHALRRPPQALAAAGRRRSTAHRGARTTAVAAGRPVGTGRPGFTAFTADPVAATRAFVHPQVVQWLLDQTGRRHPRPPGPGARHTDSPTRHHLTSAAKTVPSRVGEHGDLLEPLPVKKHPKLPEPP